MGRYHCQEILPEMGKLGQQKLAESSVTIVGLGALGAAASEMLCRAGVGTIRLIDFDLVEKRNLHRQTLFTETDIGQPKAAAAMDRLRAINSEVAIESMAETLTDRNIGRLLDGTELVLDCTDNLETRYLINEFCFEREHPWIHSAAVGTKGSVLFIRISPCFACVFAEKGLDQSCSSVGILPTLPAVVASVQVTEALKFLLGREVEKRLIRIDAWKHSVEFYTVSKAKDCPVCGN